MVAICVDGGFGIDHAELRSVEARGVGRAILEHDDGVGTARVRSTGVQSALEVPAPSGLCMICDWQFLDADVLWVEDTAVGAAVHPANAGCAPPNTMIDTTVPVVAARPASDPTVTLGDQRWFLRGWKLTPRTRVMSSVGTAEAREAKSSRRSFSS